MKVYTRNDEDWLALSWNAQSLLLHLVRVVDRSGVLETRRGPSGVAMLLRGPLEVIEPALAELIREGQVQQHELGYVIPWHLDAQDAVQSDRQRQRLHRERRRGETSRDVTNRDEHEEDVTSGNASSREVTTDRQTRQTDETAAFAALAVAEINRLARTRYEPTSAETVKHCKGLVKRGVTVADVPRVIAAKWAEWSNDSKMRDHFKPATLLRPGNFIRYREDLDARAPSRPRLALPSSSRVVLDDVDSIERQAS